MSAVSQTKQTSMNQAMKCSPEIFRNCEWLVMVTRRRILCAPDVMPSLSSLEQILLPLMFHTKKRRRLFFHCENRKKYSVEM
jgi:hypothetical protein